MKLNELIKQNSWLSIELIFLELYPKEEKNISGYEETFKKLLSIPPVDNDMIIEVSTVIDDYDNEEYIDISGRKEDEKKQNISYALEFTSWSEWLGMRINKSSLKNFTELEIIAHCLFEMTFVGFDEDEIKDEFTKIDNTIEEYKQLSEEEKKSRAFSLEDLEQQITASSTKQPDNTILTLDAGGTNLVFNAIDAQNNVIKTTTIPAPSIGLDEFIKKLLTGFQTINQETGNKASAISFCFPGPADYEKGIIGDLENLPYFRGGIPLKHILENEFKIPVYINNDGDLFTLGEAISGLLPQINLKLKENANNKQYRNLMGVTLGTGTGGGIVINEELLIGDNSAGGEINRTNNFVNPEMSIEETLSIRGIKNLYCEASGTKHKLCPDPFEIYEIGTGKKSGNSEAAIKAWGIFGTVLGHALANAITLIDGLIVIGGGLSGAHPLFLPKAIEAMNGKFSRTNGETVQRLETFAYNLENPDCLNDFLQKDEIEINIPNSTQKILYSPTKKIGVGISKLGTSNAVAVGAYAFANSNTK